MLGVDNTSEILYHYLRELHVKVSKMTVHRLLDNPLGNSMRGISDALDSLHISIMRYINFPKNILKNWKLHVLLSLMIMILLFAWLRR